MLIWMRRSLRCVCSSVNVVRKIVIDVWSQSEKDERRCVEQNSKKFEIFWNLSLKNWYCYKIILYWSDIKIIFVKEWVLVMVEWVKGGWRTTQSTRGGSRWCAMKNEWNWMKVGVRRCRRSVYYAEIIKVIVSMRYGEDPKPNVVSTRMSRYVWVTTM